MSKTQILLTAMAIVGLAGLAHADDLPTGQQSGPRYLSILPGSNACSSGSCSSCSTSGGCSLPSCNSCNSCSHDRSCLSALWSFFTYRRLPYTDINTYCCSCCGPARPPLYVYMLHPCADKAAPLTLPDLSKCDGAGCGTQNGHCLKCGHQFEQGCNACPVCGK